MTELNRELILSLACEGGLLRIYSHADRSGVQQFSGGSFGSGGLDMSDFQDESPSPGRRRRASKKIPAYDSLEAVMKAEGLNGLWVRLTPLEVHPDVRNDVWELRLKVMALSTSEVNAAEDSDMAWSQICGR